MRKTLTTKQKIFNWNLISSRRKDWLNYYTEHGGDKGSKLFRQKYGSDPTPQEDAFAGVNRQETKHVYMITDGEYIKIGISNNTLSRLTALQTSNARKLRVAIVIPNAGAKHEANLHLVYKDKRAKGEWFKIDEEIAQDVNELLRINYETYGQPFSQCLQA